MARKRAAILISGRGSNMAALIEAAAEPDYPAEIALVVSNRPEAAGSEERRAQPAFRPRSSITRAFGKDREAFEHEMHAVLAAHRIEIVCLAGFMRLLTPWFIARWEGRMINIHPALLPAFKGLDTHERALAAGVRLHGATVHFVVPEIDSGPIIAQAAVPVLDDDTADTLAARVLEAEHRIYPLALRWVAEGRVSMADGRCRIEGSIADETVLIAPSVRAS